ncbi:MAG: alpha-ketoglutarate-dependent dioxygenase AlkB [Luteimonas sp.]
MPQATLFDDGPQVLIEDAGSGVRYWPGFIDEQTAADWFSTLRDTIHWQSERRPMYDRVVDVPRLLAGFALLDAALPAVLRDAGTRVRDKLDVEFTHVGLNFYRDGRDSVAPHNDKLHSIVVGKPIALLSLGAARRMDIRDKLPPKVTRCIKLQPGSLLVMSHDSQKHYDHGIPKTKQTVGARISVVFRVRP